MHRCGYNHKAASEDTEPSAKRVRMQMAGTTRTTNVPYARNVAGPVAPLTFIRSFQVFKSPENQHLKSAHIPTQAPPQNYTALKQRHNIVRSQSYFNKTES